MAGTMKAAMIVAITLSGTVLTDRIIPTMDIDKPSTVRTEDVRTESVPVVLQPVPDEALDCRIETEREFVPARRAFVMKKVMVCR